MTTEERFERIEHVTAALVEERRRDREEHRQLWRETQLQINENSAAIAALTLKMADTQDAIAQTNDAIRAETERARNAEQELRDRIAALTSAIGQLITRLPPPQ
jgi:hypothetical protein